MAKKKVKKRGASRAPGRHLVDLPDQRSKTYAAFRNKMIPGRYFIIPEHQAAYYRKEPNTFEEVSIAEAEAQPEVDDRRRDR